MYKSIKIEKGQRGFGGPLTINLTDKKNKIVSVTGGGIDPVAQYIADMTGGIAVDGFKKAVPDDEIALVVIDCGGTARCGVYPKKGIFTVNLLPGGKTGPLAQYITEDLYVSDVSKNCIEVITSLEVKEEKRVDTVFEPQGQKFAFLSRIGKSVGGVIAKFYQAGRDAIDTTIKNILPFMAFVSLIVGIIVKTGVGNFLANSVSPLAGTLPGLILISLICCIPVLSPVLGPGAVIAQVVGVLIGVEIGKGTIPPAYALPALFAIDGQVGCDFIPVGLSLGEASSETVEIGIPAILFSRLITGPLSVIIAYFLSAGMFS